MAHSRNISTCAEVRLWPIQSHFQSGKVIDNRTKPLPSPFLLLQVDQVLLIGQLVAIRMEESQGGENVKVVVRVSCHRPFYHHPHTPHCPDSHHNHNCHD